MRIDVPEPIRRVVAIDFEASCLPRYGRSFPIEVGVADPAGWTRSWLIRPLPEWREWSWTREAQALHGITREQLLREGRPVAAVVTEFCDAVRGRRLFADSYLDDGWMRTLMAGAGQRHNLAVRHVDALADELGLTDGMVRACVAQVDRQRLPRHRAGDDARWLAAVIGAFGATTGAMERWHAATMRASSHVGSAITRGTLSA